MAKSKKASSVTAAAKILGAKGGKVGGPARERSLTKGEKTKIAVKAGKASGRSRRKK